MQSIYRREDSNVNPDLLRNHEFNLRHYRARANQLRAHSKQYSLGLGNLLTSKQSLMTRFLGTIAQETRNLIAELREDIDSWLKDALAPLNHRNLYQKKLLDEQLLQLANLNLQNHGQQEQVQLLKSQIASLEGALMELDSIIGATRALQPTAEARDNVVNLHAKSGTLA
jgi:phage shock protein A